MTDDMNNNAKRPSTENTQDLHQPQAGTLQPTFISKVNAAILNAIKDHVHAIQLNDSHFSFSLPAKKTDMTGLKICIYLMDIHEDTQRRTGISLANQWSPQVDNTKAQASAGNMWLSLNYLIILMDQEKTPIADTTSQIFSIPSGIIGALASQGIETSLCNTFGHVETQLLPFTGNLASIGSFWQSAGHPPRLALKFQVTLPLPLSLYTPSQYTTVQKLSISPQTGVTPPTAAEPGEQPQAADATTDFLGNISDFITGKIKYLLQAQGLGLGNPMKVYYTLPESGSSPASGLYIYLMNVSQDTDSRSGEHLLSLPYQPAAQPDASSPLKRAPAVVSLRCTYLIFFYSDTQASSSTDTDSSIVSSAIVSALAAPIQELDESMDGMSKEIVNKLKTLSYIRTCFLPGEEHIGAIGDFWSSLDMPPTLAMTYQVSVPFQLPAPADNPKSITRATYDSRFTENEP